METIITPAGEVNYPYTAMDLSAEIAIIPNTYGRLNDMNLMPIESGSSTLVEIGFENGVLTILGAAERGQAGPAGAQPTEQSRIVKIPHFPHQEVIKAGDLQDKFVFGSGRQQRRSVDTETAKRLMSMRGKFGITLEFGRMGALKGEIRDGKNVVLYDLFSVFNIQQKVVDFKLGTAGTDVIAKIDEVVHHIEDNLMGEVMTSVHALVDHQFFGKLTKHANVEKYYLQHQAAMSLANDFRQVFPFRGMTFESYRAVASDMTGTSRRFIAANEGHAFPLGTQETFRTHVAPPDHVQFANSVMDSEIFVSPHVLPHGLGVELKGQMNALPICRRPALLVKIHSSD
ncbi:MAG: major capsid protein [Rhodospirillales bacterium]|nr:major capsid protein [Rhodospirillales bacterium]